MHPIKLLRSFLRGAPRKKRVLAVDNDPVILKLIQRFLEKNDYEVRVAQSGLAALDMMEIDVPDFMLIDMIMPNIDGERLCRIIRKMPDYNDVRLIILSGVAIERAVDFREFGADACIAKGPFGKIGKHILSVLNDDFSKKHIPGKNLIRGAETVFRREVSKDLLTHQRHFELILHHMTEGIFEITADYRIVYVNPAAAALAEVPEETLLAETFTELFDGRIRRRVERMLRLRHRLPYRQPFYDDIVALKGKWVTMDVLPGQADSFTTRFVIIKDVTVIKNAETALKRSHAHLRIAHERRKALSRQLIQVLEQDRSNMSRELHDHVGQILISLKLDLGMIVVGSPETKSGIDRILAKVSGLIDDVKRISCGLRPVMMGTLGLEKSLAALIDDIRTASGVDIRFAARQISALASGDVELTIYRIIQEALNNVVKHAQAKNVFIDLKKNPRSISLMIQDDGKGFDTRKAMQSETSKKAMGLLIMQERTVQLGGRFSLASDIGQGTRLLINIPYP